MMEAAGSRKVVDRAYTPFATLNPKKIYKSGC
jgi:hypothetical protein